MGDHHKALRDLCDVYSVDYSDLMRHIKECQKYMPPVVRFGPGDVVMALKTGKSAMVDAVWYDPDLNDFIVTLGTTADCYRQKDLALLCSVL